MWINSTSSGNWLGWHRVAMIDYLCNPNLLDNWYFVNPVNQRDGYIVPAGVNYYTFTWEKIGQTDKTYQVLLRRNAENNYDCEIEINGTRYVVAGADAIPGYCGNWLYTIDRWNLADGDGLLEIHDGYITYKDSAYFFQPIPKDTVKSFIGKTVTLSFLYSDGTLDTGSCNITSWSGSWNVFLEIGNIRIVGVDKDLLWVSCTANGKGMIAAKLELGDTQTLAHKEGDTWVLNEIPDFGEQLARCQRYCIRFGNNADYYILGTGTARSSTICGIVVPIPVKMRVRPVCVFSGKINLRNSDNSILQCTSVVVDADGTGASYLACVASGLTEGASYDAYLEPTNSLYLAADI